MKEGDVATSSIASEGIEQRGQGLVDDREPLVSVVVTVYNHEKYIRRCLEGIACQQTDYPFEVLIGEDCSPDGSRAILKEMQGTLPSNFRFFYRECNMGAMGDNNSADLLSRARGKYLAICEGDDYWTYEGKLQKQVEWLESHPDYSACFHHCEVVGADDESTGERYPDCLEQEYSYEDYFFIVMPGQTGTLVTRMEPYLREKARFMELASYDNYASDRRNAFILLNCGRVKVFQEKWSAYRHITSGGTSHSATLVKDESFARNEIGFHETLCSYAERWGGTAEALRTARRCLYRVRFRWSHGATRLDNLGEVIAQAWNEEDRWGCLLSELRWYAVLGARMLRGRSVII
ncbi:MAG: glycosyltransferase [Atopobiaceae bacterium]|nr:glycosyltransferase [Atopobiaceae bacterium]MBQ6410911.1 glycosyltransferase [Atopobiaceae bacterium]MBQ6524512.1 glycosyltransferase [Atopobiaceae bacterium]